MLDVSLRNKDPKHWVLTRCGKVILVEDHSVRDFVWHFADPNDPSIIERANQFDLDFGRFTRDHPKIENVDDAIANQLPYFYWFQPNEITYSIINVAENDSGIVFLKTSDIDLLVGDDNWTLVDSEHDAYISFSKRLEMFRSQSEKISDKLYFLGEDDGWLVLLRMQANNTSESVKVEGMIFNSDPLLQLNNQTNWDRHGNKRLHLAFTLRSSSPNLQDSIWINVGWQTSSICLRSHLKICKELVNDNRFR